MSTLVAIMALHTSSGASQWQDVDEIQRAAEAFARHHTSGQRQSADVEAQPVDRRLRLQPCAAALEAYLPPGGRLRDNGVVGVRCKEPVAWKLFVPVRVVRRGLVARVRGQLPAGHRLRAEDVEWHEQILRGPSNVMLKGVSEPVGQVLRHPAQDGQALRLSMLRPAHVVRRGDVVTLAVGGAALRIRMQGEALGNGAIGQRVRAKNQSSGRIVEGIVRANGLVEINVF